MTDHEHYEILCALAVTGQLDHLEGDAFEAHRMHCAACRDRLQDLVSIGLQLQLNASLQLAPASMSPGSRERFRTRTIREGIAPRSVPTSAFASFARASAAAFCVIVASLVFGLSVRKPADPPLTSTAIPIVDQQSPTVSANRRTVLPRPAKTVRARFGKHDHLRLLDNGVSDASLSAQRFPQKIAVSYPYFGAQVALQPTRPQYPALSGSQISRLDLFRTLGEPTARAGSGISPLVRPIDIASTEKAFDFAAQIRQLRFQLPTAQ